MVLFIQYPKCSTCQKGMLVKRPLVIGDDFILVGFKENEWKEHFTSNKG